MDEAQSADLKALKERELAELQRIASVARHWTLAQAAAWIVFRDISVVALFTPPRVCAWITYLMYPTDWAKPVVHEQWQDLFRKLEAKLLVATGQRSADGIREEIDAKYWVDLVPEPPRVYRRVVCSMTRRLYRVSSGLHTTPPLLLRVGCIRWCRGDGGCYTSPPI